MALFAMLDFDVQRCTRRCSASDRELKPGEPCYSALVPRGAQVVRLDFAADAWPGPPDNSLGWWKARVPDGGNQRVAWAPNDVMLDYFEHLADRPDKVDVRYVLALLLIRRRVIRLENTLADDDGHETLVVFCPRNEQESQVVALLPDDARVAEIQSELSTLLFGDATSLMPPPAAAPPPPPPLAPTSEDDTDNPLAGALVSEPGRESAAKEPAAADSPTADEPDADEP